ncbi:unnamed protein product [Acanthoscelides obtectus]|uniref:Uncharacterized protein n=1 Tax=Acanthoscelides obtectus TaxID=200917 RepID=A0A9P0LHW6_ACAOB|nr:unnamed protein product [Acanthoscelides obtectus]CAK1638668.1 hypothetical protein AOBTE_LOCUS10746 [Acanthoscelides obtectus]
MCSKGQIYMKVIKMEKMLENLNKAVTALKLHDTTSNIATESILNVF